MTHWGALPSTQIITSVVYFLHKYLIAVAHPTWIYFLGPDITALRCHAIQFRVAVVKTKVIFFFNGHHMIVKTKVIFLQSPYDSLMAFALAMTTSQVTTRKHIMGWIWWPWGHAVWLPNGTVVKSGNGFPHENAVWAHAVTLWAQWPHRGHFSGQKGADSNGAY